MSFLRKTSFFTVKFRESAPLISYEGTSAGELINDFHEAVDGYLALCKENGKEPEKAYKGSFNVRISPELHKKIAVYAMEHNMTLNSLVEQSVEKQLAAAY